MQSEKLTVLIPFRNREENLKVFIPYFHNFMRNHFSDLNYEIVVVEQCNDKYFNKGILFNAGFLLTSGNTDYYALHDVDQLPITADYTYSKNPVHICVNCIEQGRDGKFINFYKDTGYQQRGGAIIISKEHYSACNGHSNKYWGWGCIDDDFSIRLIYSNIGLYRKNINNDLGYFVTLSANTKRFNDDENYKINLDYAKKIMSKEIDYRSEGLNNIKFKLIDTIIKDDYTLIKINF